MTEKKKVRLWISCVRKKKKDKRGTLKERLLASAVALLLWVICLSFVDDDDDDDVFIFLVLGKKKKKKLIKKKVRNQVFQEGFASGCPNHTFSVFRLSLLPGRPNTFEALDCEFYQ